MDSSHARAEIGRCKKRIAEIEARQETVAKADANGGVLVEIIDDYARVTFAEKPSRDILNALRAAGYRWGGGTWFGMAAALPACVQEATNAP